MSWSAAVWESRPPEWDHDLAAASLFSLTHHRSSAPSIAPPSLADSSSTFASDEVQRVQDATSKMSIQQGPPVVIGLKLGKRTYFEQNAATNYGPKKRFDHHIPQCQVHGCKADLSGCKPYHRRHKVCEMHSKTPKNVVAGQEQRFCQQCSRFHLLTEFDEGKRSCRRRLAGHNERRRKPQNEGVTAALAASIPFFAEGFNAKNAMDFMVAQAQQREAIMDGSYLGSTWHKASADYSQQLKQHLLLLNQQQQHQRTNSNDNNKNSSSSSSNLASAAHDQLLKCRVATPMEAHGALSLLSAELCSSSASSIKTPAMVHQHNLGQFAEPLDSSSSMFDS